MANKRSNTTEIAKEKVISFSELTASLHAALGYFSNLKGEAAPDEIPTSLEKTPYVEIYEEVSGGSCLILRGKILEIN